MNSVNKIEIEPPFPKHINPETESVAFFIGAGASRLIGCPGWDDLVNKIIDTACNETIINHHEGHVIKNIQDNKLRMQAIYQKFFNHASGEPHFLEVFRNKIDPDREYQKDFIENITIFKSLKGLSQIFNRIYYITTNADTRFNDYYQIFSNEKVYPENFPVADLEQAALYRIHGSIMPGLEKSLVFTMSQYLDRYNDDKFIDFLKKLFSETAHVIFVGYGLAEVELLKYILPNTSSKKYWLKEYFREELTRANSEFEAYQSIGVEIIPYAIDDNGYNQLVKVIENWHSQLKIAMNKVPELQGKIDNAIRITDQEA